MKNIISRLIIVLSISLLFSCSKELEYGSDFEFKISNIDNNSIVVNTEKTFELKLSKFFNQNSDKIFQLSYECDNVSLIRDNITLLKGINYDFTFNELSNLNLILIAEKKGDFTLKIKLTDANGLQKEQQVIVKVVEDMNFSFVQEQPKINYEEVLSTALNFNFSLKSIGSGGDSYKIKALRSHSGLMLINNEPVQANQLINVSSGNINVVFTPDTVGKQTLTLVVVNSKNLEKEITIDLLIIQKPFMVTTSKDFDVKQTLEKQFSVIATGTIPNWTYQVMFKSKFQAKISSSVGTFIPLNTYVDLPINSATFSFKYESHQTGVDPFEIYIKDKNGQIVMKNVLITVYSIPTATVTSKLLIESSIAQYESTKLLAKYSFKNMKSYGQNVTITDYEFKIFNYRTKSYDIYTDAENNLMYPTTIEYIIYSRDRDSEREMKKNYYLNQPYTARIKDSDGAWSDIISGFMSY